jgi:hypothetical protein
MAVCSPPRSSNKKSCVFNNKTNFAKAAPAHGLSVCQHKGGRDLKQFDSASVLRQTRLTRGALNRLSKQRGTNAAPHPSSCVAAGEWGVAVTSLNRYTRFAVNKYYGMLESANPRFVPTSALFALFLTLHNPHSVVPCQCVIIPEAHPTHFLFVHQWLNITQVGIYQPRYLGSIALHVHMT